MRKPNWYVIWVQSGREQRMCSLIERVCSDAADRVGGRSVLEECFTPRIATQRKYQGEWQRVERLLLPGYVIAVTGKPAELAELLRSVPDFTRLLGMGETIVPLREEDQAWLEEVTHKNDRVVPMSMAVRDGDKLVVTEGPLKGREGMIVRVNRHKSLAFLEFNIAGKRVTTRVGLGILAERDQRQQDK